VLFENKQLKEKATPIIMDLFILNSDF